MDANSDAIVSRDHHLLSLEVFEGIPIMTVIRFPDLLADQRMP
jgi:predicted nucleic acid-binding protein